MSGLRTIVGIGEALTERRGDSEQPAGLPLDLAWFAQRLGDAGVLVSRVGQDRPGEAFFAALSEWELDAEHLQSDPDLPTGTVVAETGEVAEGAAWDTLQWDGDLESLAAQAEGVCFGTLALRASQSRNTVLRFVDEARRAARLLAMVEGQPALDRRETEKALDLAGALLIDQGALGPLRALLRLPDAEHEAAEKLRATHHLGWVAVNHGGGVTVYTDAGAHEGEASAPSNAGASGAATAAALLHGQVRRWDWPRTLKLANALGAHAASHTEARPELTDALKQLAD